MASKLLASQGH